ncbi:MAG: hypothetical protein KTQ49_01245 [Candidatus Omnitrophica bacterium]|nr:hypothetical protein [Candidatus Omnitrophota bacterium]
MKTRNSFTGKVFWALVLGVGLFFSRVSAQDIDRSAGGTAAEEGASGITAEQLNAMKAEWEAVREQQIRMIREKEDQLEALKEELFSKLQADKKGEDPLSPVADKLGDLSVPEQKPHEEAGSLAVRGTTVAVKELVSVQGAPMAAVANEEAAMSVTTHEELERQKEAFAIARRKFFQEVNRQKERLFALQSSLDDQERRIREERERLEKEKPASSL